jgi:hypothetical protein
MNRNKWVRQMHRWLSMVFTVPVIVNSAAVVRGEVCLWSGPLGGVPARLAAVHRSRFVRAAVRHQVGLAATLR